MKKSELKEQLHESFIFIECYEKIIEAYQTEVKELAKQLNKKIELKVINIKNQAPFKILGVIS